MSYCEIITFKDGKPDKSLECKNAWGGAAYIWDMMFKTFLKDPSKEFDTWLTHGDCLWKLQERSDVPAFMKAVHVSTYDRAIVRKEHFGQFVKDLREFLAFFGTSGRICHLETWAKVIEDNPDVEAIGFYATSVSDNPWSAFNEELETSTPYDLTTGTDHFEVYDSLGLSRIDEAPACSP